MPGEDQFDFRRPERFDKIESFLTGYPEDILDSFLFQGTDEKVGGLHSIIP
jgi:hypothetical protein